MLTYTIKTANNRSEKICPIACTEPEVDLGRILMNFSFEQVDFYKLKDFQKLTTDAKIRFNFPELILNG